MIIMVLLTDPLSGSSLKVCQLQLKMNQIKSFTNYAIYIIKIRSRINRIEIKVKLTNRSVLCYIKNSLKFLKKVLLIFTVSNSFW